MTHPDGRLQRVRQAIGHVPEVRPGWCVLSDLCDARRRRARGAERRDGHLAASPQAVGFYSGITLEEIGGRGVRWQDRDAAANLPAPRRSRRPARGAPRAAARGCGWAPPRRSGRARSRAMRPRSGSSRRCSAPSSRRPTPSAWASPAATRWRWRGRRARPGFGGAAAGRTPRERLSRVRHRRGERHGAHERRAAHRRGHEGMTLMGAEGVVLETTLVQIVKAVVIFGVDLLGGAPPHAAGAQADRPLSGSARAQPGRARRPHAAAGRRPQAALQGAVGARHRRPVDDGDRAGDHRDHRGRDARDHPLRPAGRLGRRPRAVRHRRADRAALLLRLRLARVLRLRARRLGLRLEVLVPRRHALRRAAHLLRGGASGCRCSAWR